MNQKSLSSDTLLKNKKTRSMYIVLIILSIITGLFLAPFLSAFGIITLPLVFFMLFILPWLIQNTFRLFVWLIVTWPLLYIFVRIRMPAGIPDITYDRLMLLLLVGVFTLEIYMSKRQPSKITTLDILALIYVLVQLNSRLLVVLLGGMGKPDLNGLLDTIIMPLMLYWIIKNLLVSSTHLKWLLYAFVVACLLICLTGLYEQVIGVKVFKFSNYNLDWGPRATGVMMNPAIYGATLGLGILAGFSLLSHVKRRLIQTALIATIGILLYGVLASLTRSAWLSVLIVMFVAQFFMNGLWKWTLPIFMLGLLFLILVWPMLSTNSLFMRRALTEDTVTNRVSIFIYGWSFFTERPLLGWGAGALNIFSDMRGIEQSHNIYLTFLVDGGVLLLFSFLILVGYLMIMAIRVYGALERSSLERNAVVAMFGFVLIFLLSGFAVELRYFGYINALFWICMGVIDALNTKLTLKKSFLCTSNNPMN